MPKVLASLLIVIVLLAIAYGAYIIGTRQAEVIADFEDCVAAGYPVFESYPGVCKTPEGDTFVEDVGNVLEKASLIELDRPRPNELIKSPLVIEGRARGNWYFEASFPVKIIDGNGNVLATAPAQAQGEWMTTEFVPFRVEISFPEPATEKGMLVLEKDNPSGLPGNADELRIPIRFEESK